jgi:hypothetical protein
MTRTLWQSKGASDGPALVVLGMEELAKARWLYEEASWQWSKPLGLFGMDPQPAGEVLIPESLSPVSGQIRVLCEWPLGEVSTGAG